MRIGDGYSGSCKSGSPPNWRYRLHDVHVSTAAPAPAGPVPRRPCRRHQPAEPAPARDGSMIRWESTRTPRRRRHDQLLIIRDGIVAFVIGLLFIIAASVVPS